MAEDQEEVPFKFVTNEGVEGKSSRDYTGKGMSYYLAKNETYEGDFRKGLRHGKGIYKYNRLEEPPEEGQPMPAIPSVYEGDFVKTKEGGAKQGIGKMTYLNGETYYGQWENGKKHGEGIYTYANKDVYTGWWAFGNKTG